jgi:hypothetical protein
MAEQESERREGYKVWKQAVTPDEPIQYLGEFYPPPQQAFFTNQDLRDLGFPPGQYTVLIPASVRAHYAVDKWQSVTVGE